MLSFLGAAVIAAGCAGSPAKLTPFPPASRPVAAVMDFDYRASATAFSSSAAGMADAVTTALVGTERLKLVERRRLETAFTEMKLAMTGVIDSNTAVEAGKLVGADYVIVGSITNVSVRDEGRTVGFAAKTTRYVNVEAEARMLEVKTGLLVASGRAEGKADGSEKRAFGGKMGALPTAESLVQQALMGLGEKLANSIAANVQPLK